MKKITFLLSFIACVVFAQAQTNLVVNPGFETWTDNTTPGVNWTPTVVASQSFAKESTLVHSGSFSLKSVHAGTTGTAKIITKPYIVVTAGTTYTFSFWYYAEASTTNLLSALRMWGYWENPDGTNGTFDQTGLQPSAYIDLTNVLGSWQKFSVDITAPAGSGQLELDIRFYKRATIYIDDVSLVAVSTGVNNPSSNKLQALVSGKSLLIKNVTEGSNVEIYSALGSKVQTSTLENGKVSLSNLAKGMYLVRVGKLTQKFML